MLVLAVMDSRNLGGWDGVFVDQELSSPSPTDEMENRTLPFGLSRSDVPRVSFLRQYVSRRRPSLPPRTSTKLRDQDRVDPGSRADGHRRFRMGRSEF